MDHSIPWHARGRPYHRSDPRTVTVPYHRLPSRARGASMTKYRNAEYQSRKTSKSQKYRWGKTCNRKISNIHDIELQNIERQDIEMASTESKI